MNLITGASGLVGSWLLLELSKRGKPIRAMKRSDSSIEPVKKLFTEFLDLSYFEKIEWVDADLLNLPSLEKSMDGVETVFHTAAFISFDARDRKEIYKTNVTGTENLVNTATVAKVQNFVLLSSVSALDIDENKKIIDENSKWNPELPHSWYAISKKRSELEFFRISEEFGVNILIVNPSVIIGSLNASRASESLFERSLKKKAFSTGGKTGFVDVRDVAFCLAELVEENKWNQKFILNSENKHFYEVIDFIRQEKKLKKAYLISDSKLKWLKKLSKLNRLFGGLVIDDATYIALTGITEYSNEKVKTALNFKFIPVEESISFHRQRFERLKS